MIDPRSAFKEKWDTLVAILTTYKGIETPARIAFQYSQSDTLWALDIFCYVIFIADIILHFRTASVVQGKIVRDSRRVAIKYLRGWFIFDFIGSIPFRYLAERFLNDSGLLWEWAAMARLMRLGLFTAQIVRKQTSAFLVRRLVVFLFWIALIIHLISCGWIMLGGIDSHGGLYNVYLRAVYWTIATLSTIGYGDIVPKNNPQTLFAIFTMVIGAGIYATMIANIASILTRIDGVRADYQEKLHRLHTFMHYHKLPFSLRKQILNYYAYSWETGLGYNEETVLSDLPPSLRQSVVLSLNKDIVEKVPIFSNADEAVLHKLMQHMKSVIYMPGDYVFREGEVGKKMYFINNGRVEITSEKNKIHAIVGEGGFFGEVALLNHAPRIASVKALDFCTFYSLDRDALESVFEEFPEFAKQIKKASQERH